MTYARIAGIGSCLPGKVGTNKGLEKTLDTTDEWIRAGTGSERGHMVSAGGTTASAGLITGERVRQGGGVAGCEM